jgi:hypothetical protein
LKNDCPVIQKDCKLSLVLDFQLHNYQITQLLNSYDFRL